MGADISRMKVTPWSQVGHALMACCFEVHNNLGGGLLEEIYQESLEIELSEHGLPYVSKPLLDCFYKSQALQKKYVPDLLLHGRIVVELKAASQLATEHEAQLINYMRLSRSCVGYLVNFGPIGRLEWKRRILSEFIRSNDPS